MAIKPVLFISQHSKQNSCKSWTEMPYQFPVAWLTLCESEVFLNFTADQHCDSEVAHNIPVDWDWVRLKWSIPFILFDTLWDGSFQCHILSFFITKQSVELRYVIPCLSRHPVLYWRLTNFSCHLVLCQMKFPIPYMLFAIVPSWRAIYMVTCSVLVDWVPITHMIYFICILKVLHWSTSHHAFLGALWE